MSNIQNTNDRSEITDIPVVILCGGKGTRLGEITQILPKPMVQIGNYPIVLHIMKWYAKFGARKFILCLGYKKEVFVTYFSNFLNNISDIKIDLANGNIKHYADSEYDWEITLADTEIDSLTGTRLKKVAKYIDSDRFFLTYGDGLSDVDITKLYQRHLDSGNEVTITQVNSPGRFGIINTDANGTVLAFDEKTKPEGYINGGFMVLEKDFIRYYITDNKNVMLEADPFESCIREKKIGAFTHNGFWQCMDNAKEHELLNSLWKSGNAPWKVE